MVACDLGSDMRALYNESMQIGCAAFGSALPVDDAAAAVVTDYA
jgi:hypothetical protein